MLENRWKKVLKKCWKSCHRDVTCRRNRQNVVRKQGKSRPGDEKTIKSYPGEGKTLIFHSALLVKKNVFRKSVYDSGRHGRCEFLNCSGGISFSRRCWFWRSRGSEISFLKKKAFWENMFQKYFPKNIFLGKIFPDKILPGQIFSWPGAVSFILGGRAWKITPVIYPLIFENFFGHENSRRGSCGAAIFFVLLEISSRGPFWAQKWRG